MVVSVPCCRRPSLPVVSLGGSRPVFAAEPAGSAVVPVGVARDAASCRRWKERPWIWPAKKMTSVRSVRRSRWRKSPPRPHPDTATMATSCTSMARVGYDIGGSRGLESVERFDITPGSPRQECHRIRGIDWRIRACSGVWIEVPGPRRWSWSATHVRGRARRRSVTTRIRNLWKRDWTNATSWAMGICALGQAGYAGPPAS